MSQFCSSPKAEVKVGMAKAIVTQFPHLKDPEGEGYVSHLFSNVCCPVSSTRLSLRGGI